MKKILFASLISVLLLSFAAATTPTAPSSATTTAAILGRWSIYRSAPWSRPWRGSATIRTAWRSSARY